MDRGGRYQGDRPLCGRSFTQTRRYEIILPSRKLTSERGRNGALSLAKVVPMMSHFIILIQWQLISHERRQRTPRKPNVASRWIT